MKTARQEVINKERIAKYRKDVLMLAKAGESVFKLKQIPELVKAVVKWSAAFDEFGLELRRDLEGRLREAEVYQIPLEPGHERPDAGWVKYYLEHISPLFTLGTSVRRVPRDPELKRRSGGEFEEPAEIRRKLIEIMVREDRITPEEAARKADNYSFLREEWTREEAETHALSGWVERAKPWAAKVRRDARAAWAYLEELSEWSQRAVGGRRELQVPVHEEENHNLEGFQLIFRGFEETRYADSYSTLREALRRYRTAAMRKAPILMKLQVPMYIQWNFEAGAARDAAAYYAYGKIFITPWALGDKPDELVKTLAHEMGHHVYKAFLSEAARVAWSAFIRGDYKQLDLREALQTVKRLGASDMDGDEVRDADPILFLQMGTLLHHPALRELHLYSVKRVEEYLAKGESPLVNVPTHPITAYAGKNSEEAFCEALGNYVAYGPRAVFPVVYQMLESVLHNKIRTAALAPTQSSAYHSLSVKTAAKKEPPMTKQATITALLQDAREVKAALVPGREFYLPKEVRGTPGINPPGTDIEYWAYEQPGHGGKTRPMLTLFVGKQAKPLIYAYYSTPAQRDTAIDQAVYDRKSRLKSKADRAQAKKEWVPDTKVGDIFVASWGYDQTNLNWYEVVAVKGKMAMVREIGSRAVSENQNITMSVPVPGRYIGPPERKLLQKSPLADSRPYFKVTSFSSAQLWEGKPKYETTTGWGH